MDNNIFVANEVARQILEDFKTNHDHNIAFKRGYPQYYMVNKNQAFVVKLDKRVMTRFSLAIDDADSLFIDLKQIDDEVFIKRIEKTVTNLTDGVVEVDIKSAEYRLHLS